MIKVVEFKASLKARGLRIDGKKVDLKPQLQEAVAAGI